MQVADTCRFVTELRLKQQALGLQQKDLAALIGRGESLVSLVLNGQRPVTLGFARAVIARWPEFAAYLAADLASQSRRDGVHGKEVRNG